MIFNYINGCYVRSYTTPPDVGENWVINGSLLKENFNKDFTKKVSRSQYLTHAGNESPCNAHIGNESHYFPILTIVKLNVFKRDLSY